MSGYLASLVDRARGLGPTVEPRLRSAFEPKPRDGEPWLESAAEAAPPAATPRTRDREPAKAKPENDDAETRVVSGVPRGTAPIPRDEKRPVLKNPRAVADAPIAPRDPEDVGRVEERKAPPPAIRAAERFVPPPQIRSPATERGSTRESARATASPPVVGSPLPPRETSRRQREVRAARAEVSQRPVVRVTIGRVEVRAVVSGAAPPRMPAPPAGPKLSLDEYLSRRNGGGR